MWEDGIFLGVKGSTAEMIVGDHKGVWRTRTTRRKTEEERWAQEGATKIIGVPWMMDGREGGQDGGLKTEVTIMDKD